MDQMRWTTWTVAGEPVKAFRGAEDPDDQVARAGRSIVQRAPSECNPQGRSQSLPGFVRCCHRLGGSHGTGPGSVQSQRCWWPHGRSNGSRCRRLRPPRPPVLEENHQGKAHNLREQPQVVRVQEKPGKDPSAFRRPSGSRPARSNRPAGQSVRRRRTLRSDWQPEHCSAHSAE